jgi:CHAT domain-containing protein
MGLSGLAFAGANRGAQTDSTAADGVLTAEEISNLDLQGVATVVVSGCNTGIGVVRVREGMFGLRRAFEVAGARTLVVGLWSLRDDDSRAWMEEFYDARLVLSLGTAEAVHAASLAMLGRQRSRGGTGHPYSWAGFVATGDWQ